MAQNQWENMLANCHLLCEVLGKVYCTGQGIACEQARSEGGKKTFGDQKRDSVSEASGSVDPRAKRVGRGGASPVTPSSPDRSRLVPLLHSASSL